MAAGGVAVGVDCGGEMKVVASAVTTEEDKGGSMVVSGVGLCGEGVVCRGDTVVGVTMVIGGRSGDEGGLPAGDCGGGGRNLAGSWVTAPEII
ncbi:hypothetical protein Tco_1049375 [Tanacetum coccineum]